MNILSEGLNVLLRDGLWSFVFKSMKYMGVWDGVWNTVTSRYPVGTNVFERDWDLFVLLDTCRVDELRTIGTDTPWFGEVNEITSVASNSAEWMLNTFNTKYAEEIRDTAYVSGNIYTHRILKKKLYEETDHEITKILRGVPRWQPLETTDLAYYETVIPKSDHVPRIHPEGVAAPHVLTDRAISVGRELNPDRLIIHYMFPHRTFVADALDWEPGELSTSTLMSGPDVLRDLKPEERSYDPARRGDIDRQRMEKIRQREIRFVLEYVRILFENYDADTAVISADHAESLGENGIWGHPYGYPFGSIRRVPWAETEAIDKNTYESQYESQTQDPHEHDQKEFLRNMGYL